MARTPSRMVPLGTKAPEFSLIDSISGARVTLDDVKSDVATVVMFICNHCPFVKFVAQELGSISADYRDRDIRFVAISSNDIDQYPDDSPENMALFAKEYGYEFPYLYDETQEVAKAYGAECTPDFFVFDKNLELVYRGQLDDARPGGSQVPDGTDLRAALEALIQGAKPGLEQKPSLGCNIKWKS